MSAGRRDTRPRASPGTPTRSNRSGWFPSRLRVLAVAHVGTAHVRVLVGFVRVLGASLRSVLGWWGGGVAATLVPARTSVARACAHCVLARVTPPKRAAASGGRRRA